MEWNNGKELAKFEKEQAKKRREYLAAGMTEEQIKAIRQVDEAWYKSCRNEARHTQRLSIESSEDEDAYMDNPLYKKFMEKLAVTDNHGDYSRLGWIDDITNERLAEGINMLSDEDKELLTLLYAEGFPQKAVAEIQGVSTAAICKKLRVIKNFLRNFLQ